eukprot:6461432-Amphidinium_carterae.4
MANGATSSAIVKGGSPYPFFQGPFEQASFQTMSPDLDGVKVRRNLWIAGRSTIGHELEGVGAPYAGSFFPRLYEHWCGHHSCAKLTFRQLPPHRGPH